MVLSMFSNIMSVLPDMLCCGHDLCCGKDAGGMEGGMMGSMI